MNRLNKKFFSNVQLISFKRPIDNLSIAKYISIIVSTRDHYSARSIMNASADVSITKDQMLTQTGVLSREGWSKTLVTKLLSEPDSRKKVFGRSIPCSLYKIERILAAEESGDFKNAQDNLKRRKEAAKKAAETKKTKLLSQIDGMQITVQKLPVKTVRSLAIRSYNNWNELNGKHASLSDDTAFLDRICVNFIRHEMTEYDYALAEIAGKTGIQEGVFAIRVKIFDAIAQSYPEYASECANQL